MSAQPVILLRHVYSGTNVTTSAYVELDAVLAQNVSQMEIYDSSGESFVMAIGPAGSEVDTFNIPQGGNGLINLTLPLGARLSIKALSGTASTGDLIINFYGGR